MPPETAKQQVIIMCKKMTMLALLALLGVTPLLGACHTMAGAGKDIKETGQALQDSAAEHTP
jgi:predicted small secreted protein